MSDFLSGYKKYDPEREGFGNPQQWKRAFYSRMSPDEATKVLNEDDPWEVLGLKRGASINEIKRQFRKLMLKWHPDKNSDPKAKAMSQKIIAAYTILTS